MKKNWSNLETYTFSRRLKRLQPRPRDLLRLKFALEANT